MKITPEHYEMMRVAIEPLIDNEELALYMRAGLTQKRYRWDLWRRAGLLQFTCDVLYEYANDDHIDTALRKITNTE